MAALGTDYHFVAKSEVGSMPFFGTFLRKLGHFAFKREDPARASAASGSRSSRRCATANPFLFFRREHSRRSPACVHFHLGAFKTAIAARAADCAHCACRNAPRAARRHVASAARTHHHHDLPGDCSAIRRSELAGNRARARLGARNHRALRGRTSPVNIFCGQPLHQNRASQFSFEQLSLVSDDLGSLRVGFSVSFIWDLRQFAASKIIIKGRYKHA